MEAFKNKWPERTINLHINLFLAFRGCTIFYYRVQTRRKKLKQGGNGNSPFQRRKQMQLAKYYQHQTMVTSVLPFILQQDYKRHDQSTERDLRSLSSRRTNFKFPEFKFKESLCLHIWKGIYQKQMTDHCHLHSNASLCCCI